MLSFLSRCDFQTFIESFPDPAVAGRADILRLDRIHPLISGNKAFKLLGHIQRFSVSGRSRLLSFGGVWSNHLHALAAVAHECGIPLTAVVRGHAGQPLSATLADCADWGVVIELVDNQTYRRRHDSDYQAMLADRHDAWVVPEGGDGVDGETGLALLQVALQDYDHVWLAAGTGTTARGIAAQLSAGTHLHIVNVVADQGELGRRFTEQGMPVGWTLYDGSHGGFGRCPESLRQLIHCFDQRGLPLDPVYTAKLVEVFLSTAGLPGRHLLIHSGGLQGRRGYKLYGNDGAG